MAIKVSTDRVIGFSVAPEPLTFDEERQLLEALLRGAHANQTVPHLWRFLANVRTTPAGLVAPGGRVDLLAGLRPLLTEVTVPAAAGVTAVDATGATTAAIDIDF